MDMEYLGTEFVNFRDYEWGPAGSHAYQWVDIRSFGVDDAEGDDLRVLAGIIASEEYRDGYIGGGIDPDGVIHGPYWIASITPEAFRSTDSASASAVVDRWLTRCGTLPEALRRDLRDSAYRAIANSDACYELAELGESAIVEYGRIHTEFHELVAIDRSAKKAGLIVLADD